MVGLKHQPFYKEVLAKSIGCHVMLVPEPGNLHDMNAVACYVALKTYSGGYVWSKAGYVSAPETKFITDKSTPHVGIITWKDEYSIGVKVAGKRLYHM